MADDKEDLAKARTNLAEDRTVLAHERSYAGWVRTGMASVGIGLGLNALFRSLEPVWVAKAVATGFFVVAVFIFISALQRASKILGRLESHTVSELGLIPIRLMTWALVAITTVLAVVMWVLVPA